MGYFFHFLLNRNWDLGWILASWHYWKKHIWANYEQLLRPVFSSFHGQKKLKHHSLRTKKLHKIKLLFIFFFLKNIIELLNNKSHGLSHPGRFSSLSLTKPRLLLCAVLMNGEVVWAIIAHKVKVAHQPLHSSIRVNCGPSGSLLHPVPSSQLERHLHFASKKLCQASWMWYRFSR